MATVINKHGIKGDVRLPGDLGKLTFNKDYEAEATPEQAAYIQNAPGYLVKKEADPVAEFLASVAGINVADLTKDIKTSEDLEKLTILSERDSRVTIRKAASDRLAALANPQGGNAPATSNPPATNPPAQGAKPDEAKQGPGNADQGTPGEGANQTQGQTQNQGQ